MRSLASFTADLLSDNGALVESRDQGLEALLPEEAARLLEAPEHLQLSFASEEEGIPVSLDSDFFKKMERLLRDQGRFSLVSLPAPPLRPEKLGERIDEKIPLHNAVFQVERTEQKRISYLLAYFKYSARSDDRQEGVIASLINESNLSVRGPLAEPLDWIAREAGEPSADPEGNDPAPVLRALARAQQEMVREELKDFLSSLERRLNRDIRRVQNYYQMLMGEHRQALQKKASTAAEKEKIQSRIEAIETELKGKVQDLVGKYELHLQVEPVSFIRVETVTQILWLLIKRRKEMRSFPLAYNPILRSLDTLPCEICFYPRKGYSICDDRLHILCKPCFAPCVQCGKNYCGACHPRGCPKCGGS